jgi:hypothetical protein
VVAGTSGYTLVEAIVTLAVVALILIPLGRIFLTSQSAANDNTARQQGLGLDTAVLAKIGVARYGLVGLTSADQTAANAADPGYTAAAPGGASLVTLAGPSDLDGAFRFGPSSQIFNVVMPTVPWGDRNFKVITWVTTADTYVPACPSGPGQPATTKVPGVERKVTVSASWFSQLSGWITATESTIVYPGGLAPHRGTETRPPVPGNPTATPTATTGRVDVSWVASGSGCYSVSWVTPDQAVHSTALLAENDPGYLTAPPVGGSGTANYAVDGLPEDETLIFFVTAYTPDGTVSSVSADTGQAVPASGPLVTQVTSTTCPSGVSAPCPYGGQGSSIQVTGTGFAGASMTLVQASQSQSIGTCASSPCTLALTGLPPLSNTWSVVATAGGISSPPLIPSDFSFNPTINGVSPASGTAGTTVTVTGTNFVSGTTFTYSYSISGTNFSYTFPTSTCTPTQSSTVGATSCKLVMPASIRVALLADGQVSTNGAISATSTPGGTSPPSSGDAFTYAAV